MSNESSTVVKRTVRRTVVSGNGVPEEYDSTHVTRNYQVYRGMSPTSSNRLEIRIKELEDALEQERQGRLRAEQELSEVSFHLDQANERLDEADGLTSAQGEATRRREQELTKLKKDFELLTVQHESSEASLRKRHQEALNELSDQVEHLNKHKAKADKEKQTFVIEIDSLSTALDGANKARVNAESKLESLEDALRRLKSHNDELLRQNQEFNSWKARFTQENFELQRQVQELDASNGNLSKARSVLQQQLDDAKSRLDEESRERNQLSILVTNLQVDFDNLNARLEEEAETSASLRAQLQRSQADYQQLKSKYDKDISIRVEEIDELRRKLTARIAELEDAVEQARNRASKFEKEKIKLTIEIRDIALELEAANGNSGELAKRLKHTETVNIDLQRRVEELSINLQGASGDNQRLQAELARLRTSLGEVQDKYDAAARENKQLTDALREAQSQNKDLTRQVTELLSIRVQLESDRERLSTELIDANEALRDLQLRFETANSSLTQLRIDFEHRLRQKDEEIENIRKSGARGVEELQRTIIEIETKFKSEITRYKKKYETDLRELELQNENLNRANAELAKANKSLANRVKELEVALEDERRSGDDLRGQLTTWDRKRLALQTELEDVRVLLESSERARKNAESALSEASTRVNELTIQITTITADRRRYETDLASLHAEAEEATRYRREAEDRADRLQIEVNRLIEELRREQDNYKSAENVRKQLEVEIREISVRLEEAESFAQREGKRLVAKLQSRLRDVESELEAEQRRGRDVIGENRKLARLLQELRGQADEDHRVATELSETVNTLNLKITVLKRQLVEAEEVVQITMNKYRKAQQQLDDAERRVESAERNITVHVTRPSVRNRSMSVTRETTRIVRS